MLQKISKEYVRFVRVKKLVNMVNLGASKDTGVIIAKEPLKVVKSRKD